MTNYVIDALCKEYTDLNKDEINKIIDVSKSLNLMADFYDCDIFIDILSRYKEEAIVLIHGKPSSGKSLYSSTVVGKVASKEKEPGVLKTFKTGVASKDIKAITQENKFVKQRIVPIEHLGKIIGVLILEQDISTEISKDFNLESDSKYEKSLMTTFNSLNNLSFSLTNFLDDVILIFDSEGLLKVKNIKAETYYKNLGYDLSNANIHYDDLFIENDDFISVIQSLISNENGIISKETQVNESYFSFKTILLNHKDLVLVVIIKDITDIKEKEAQIVSKSVAIREIHHRVKNNLQTISSLLRLQSRRCESEEAKVCLMESVSRILAIASTHELLSQEVSDNVNIIEVITLIINNIKRSFDNNSKTIDINVIGEDFQIDSDRATAISLIINELIQNSYDHGFKDKEKGHIYVIVKGNGDRKQMAVIDNGVGFIEGETKSKSLGLTIVKSYVKDKLKGEMSINSNDRGTKVNIEFKM
ncbi:hypothetical protein FDG09_00485 [Clostridium sporogenes]|uniref:sensor histidine kinase n=1 Tax=Clostridium sporogenes TaxID=1509 RepID=UPI0013D00C59|nr:sensor histidine kinase [Clostridium sporogenes]NFV11444.1 hypothetical protein [Clostridium sporogenes]